MRAVLCKQYGLPDTLVVEDVPSPHPKADEVVVSVKAAALNFHDTLIIQNLYQHKPALPFSPGADLAGTVKEIGAEVKDFKPGDRVVGYLRWGAFAEEAVVPQARVALLPPEVDFATAAAFGLAYTTSYYALKNRGQLAAGETLLVLGASGGIGGAGVELGKVMGARVIACASSDEGLELSRQGGADGLINYEKEDVRAALKRLTEDRGVDVVLDPVGGKLAEVAIRNVAWKGRHLVVGFASGEIPRIPLNLTLVKGSSIVGVSRGGFMDRTPEQSKENSRELLAWLAAGKLKPPITSRYRLDQAGTALSDMMHRKIKGKAILIV